MLAHELRNPLAPISAAVAILARLDGKAIPDKLLDMVRRQVKHSVGLLDDLLDISRVTEGKVPLQRKPTAVAEIVQQAVDTCRHEMANRNHRSDLELGPEVLFVDEDPARLAQVVTNLLEKHKLAPQILVVINDLLRAKGLMLRAGTAIDATLIAAPSSTKNASGKRAPDMHQSKKGNQWYFGMKAHIGVDAESGLVHTVRGTSGNVNDVVKAHTLLHGDETEVFADAGYQGAHKRPDAQDGVNWNVAMRPGKRAALDKSKRVDQLTD